MNQIFIISITVSALWQKNDMKFQDSIWYLFEEHDYFTTRMHTRERAGYALLRTMLVKSIRTVATLIDVNFNVITKNTCRLQILTNIPDVSKKSPTFDLM